MHCEGPQGAAAISYFSLFSVFPLMLLLLAMTDQVLFIFGARDAALRSLMELFPGARRFLQEKLAEIGQPSRELVITCIFLFLWSASWMFDFLESAMNRAWQVSRCRSFLRSRILSVGIIFLCALLFLVSTTVTVVATQMAQETEQMAKEYFTPLLLSLLWKIVLIVSGFLMTLVVLTLLYKAVPNTRVRFFDAFRGALLSSVLWQSASYLFAYLVPFFNYQRVYGSIGAVVALLTWVYLSSMIVLWGIHYSAILHVEDPVAVCGEAASHRK